MIRTVLKRLFSSGESNEAEEAIADLEEGFGLNNDLVDELDTAYEELSTAIEEYQETSTERNADRIGDCLYEIRERLNAIEHHSQELVATFEAAFGNPHEEGVTSDLELQRSYDELDVELDSIRRRRREIQTDINAYEDDVDGYVEMWTLLDAESDEAFAALADDPEVMAAVDEYRDTPETDDW